MSAAVMTSRPHQHHQHKAPSATGQGNIKKALRDTLRLLQRPNLPADVRREQERKLQALQAKAVDHAHVEKEKKMSKTYRMVKFFERKKAERKLKQAKTDEAREAAIMDLNYIIHFPKDRKYIALFPTVETTDEKVLEERCRIRQEINDELVAKAKVSSILEAPLPEMIGESALTAVAGEVKVRKALNQGHKDSDEDEDDDEGEDDQDDDEDDQDDDQENSDDDDELDNDNDDDDLSDDDDDDDDNDDSDEDDSSDDDDDEDDEDESDSYDDDDDDDEDDDEDSDDDDEEDFDSEDDESDDDDDSDAPSAKRSRK
jgi:hypothetical protein